MVRNRPPDRKAGRVKDRRGAERFRAYFPATLRTIYSERQLCVCREMGVKGGVFMTSSAPRPGEALALELFVNAPEGEPRKVMARVVRVRALHSEDTRWRYDTAVEFASPTRVVTAEARALSQRQQSTGLFGSTRPT